MGVIRLGNSFCVGATPSSGNLDAECSPKIKNERTSMSSERTEFPAEPDYETKSQVARRLNVSKRTIDNLMRQRRLPYIRSSASRKPRLTPSSPGISVSELAAWTRATRIECEPTHGFHSPHVQVVSQSA